MLIDQAILFSCGYHVIYSARGGTACNEFRMQQMAQSVQHLFTTLYYMHYTTTCKLKPAIHIFYTI